jgi:hypothetical protein
VLGRIIELKRALGYNLFVLAVSQNSTIEVSLLNRAANTLEGENKVNWAMTEGRFSND